MNTKTKWQRIKAKKKTNQNSPKIKIDFKESFLTKNKTKQNKTTKQFKRLEVDPKESFLRKTKKQTKTVQ